MADITDEKKSGLLADFRWILCNYQLVKTIISWETKPANYQLDQAGRPY